MQSIHWALTWWWIRFTRTQNGYLLLVVLFSLFVKLNNLIRTCPIVCVLHVLSSFCTLPFIYIIFSLFKLHVSSSSSWSSSFSMTAEPLAKLKLLVEFSTDVLQSFWSRGIISRTWNRIECGRLRRTLAEKKNVSEKSRDLWIKLHRKKIKVREKSASGH